MSYPIRNRSSIESLDYQVVESPDMPERATVSDMKRIKKPKTMPWHARLSGPDMVKLLKGFSPTEMEQKWVIAADGPDKQGIIDVHLCRSWTGFEIYTVRARVLARQNGTPGDAEKDGGEVFEIVYETNDRFDNTSEAEVEDMATGLCRGFLGINLGKSPEPRPKARDHERYCTIHDQGGRCSC